MKQRGCPGMAGSRHHGYKHKDKAYGGYALGKKECLKFFSEKNRVGNP